MLACAEGCFKLQLTRTQHSQQHGEEEVTVANRCQIKISLMKLVRRKPCKASSVLMRAKNLRGDALVVKTLLAQVWCRFFARILPALHLPLASCTVGRDKRGR